MTQPILRRQAYDRFKVRLFAQDFMPGRLVSQRELKTLEADALARFHQRLTPGRARLALEARMRIIAAFRACDAEAATVVLDKHITVTHHHAAGLAP